MESADQKTVTWRTDVLPKATRRALEFLAAQTWLQQSPWYLAGGTALALHVGHRQSLDLDFFTPRGDFSLKDLLRHFAGKDWTTDIVREGTVYGRLLGVKVSFIAYPFFVAQEKPSWYGCVRVIPPRDIAVMKIIAISQRGRKRDFVDLYWYTKHDATLADVLRLLPEQYPTVAHDYYHILKSLAYFADAETDPMPRLFFPATWGQIKRYFQTEVPRITREFLRLA